MAEKWHTVLIALTADLGINKRDGDTQRMIWSGRMPMFPRILPIQIKERQHTDLLKI